MKFSVGSKEHSSRTAVSLIIQDGAETLLYLEVPGEQDTLDGWYTSFSYLLKTQPQELNELIGAFPQLLTIQVDEEAHPTYLKVLLALFKLTEEERQQLQEQSPAGNNLANLYGLHQQLKHALFNFEVVTSPNNEYYEVIFPHPGQGSIPVRIRSDDFDKSPVLASQVMLRKANASEPGCIEYFIHNYVHFQKYVESADSITITVFMGISKALVKLITQEKANLGIYLPFVPDICAFIVKNELDSEEQKEYLAPILRSFETAEQKLARLNGVITDVKNGNALSAAPKSASVGQLQEESSRRLMHVISVISDHYLKLYDLDSSANFWRKVTSRDPVLWFFQILHRRPFLSLLCQIVLLSIPSFFAFQHWLTGQTCPLLLGSPNAAFAQSCHTPPASSGLEFAVVLAWYFLLLILLFFIFTQIARNRGVYSQLLLPRILGAALVGLIPLLLNDQTWNIGIRSSVLNWNLLALLTYIGSFIYIFIEVHSIKKFIKGHSIVQELKESGRIFLIALSETLFIVTIASSLVFPAVTSNINIDIASDRFGIYASTAWLSFGFFPSLIILWSGITLFIGSFVQLLWQDQRITASI